MGDSSFTYIGAGDNHGDRREPMNKRSETFAWLLILFWLVFICGIFATSAHAAIAFKTGEVVTGNTKQCYYEYLGQQYIMTIKSYQLCPLIINV